ncbi:hypothetical protein ACHWQZ_G017364 [Mnemiopsis leidyi]
MNGPGWFTFEPTSMVNAFKCDGGTVAVIGNEPFFTQANGGDYTFLKTTTCLKIWFNDVLEVTWEYIDKDQPCAMRKQMTGLQFRTPGKFDKVTTHYRYEKDKKDCNPGQEELGWKEVVHDELITADLDEVGIQIRTRNNEGKVEIHVVDTDGTWHSYIEWSTASADEFNFGGTCNPQQNLSPTKQIPESELLIWTLKKEGNFFIIICNNVMVMKYDYKNHPCHDFDDFGPKIKFPSQDTASSMYKILQTTTDIVTCEAGKFWNIAAQTCENCPEGHYSDGAVKVAQCTACPVGRTVLAGQGTSLQSCRWNVEISNVEVRIGTPCTLSCSVTGLTDTVTITWSGYNDPGQIQEIDVALENGKQTKKLVLSPSEVFVDKTYTCSISSFSGSAGIQGEHAKVDVYNVVVRDIEVKYGEHATLSCMVSGLTNQVSVEWLYPTSDSEVPVPTTADYVQNKGSLDNTDLTQTSTLVISGSVVTEGKTFICRVSSSNYPNSPSSDTFVGLNVYDVEGHGTDIQNGNGATISCVISRLTSQVTVEWLDSISWTTLANVAGYTIQQGKFENASQTSTVEISGSVVTGDRTYICRVSSETYPDSPSSNTFVGLTVFACHTDDFPQYDFKVNADLIHTVRETETFTITCANEYYQADTSLTSLEVTCREDGELEMTGKQFDCFDTKGCRVEDYLPKNDVFSLESSDPTIAVWSQGTTGTISYTCKAGYVKGDTCSTWKCEDQVLKCETSDEHATELEFCTVCPAKTYHDQSIDTCKPCDPGFRSGVGFQKCFIVASGESNRTDETESIKV